MIKKKITKDHPLTAFRKTNEARQTIVKTSMKKMQTGGTPYQQYMKIPGAMASDTTRIPFDSTGNRIFPKVGSTLDNAHSATYGDDYRTNAERTGRKMPAAGVRGDNSNYNKPLKKGTSLQRKGGTVKSKKK
jgi:hypothetical protein